MTESQSSFISDTGAALQQAMGLLQQKGLIIQKYMQKMGQQQGKIQQLVQQIQRLNWESRQREYNEEMIRRVNMKDLIQDGFVEMVEVNDDTKDSQLLQQQQGDDNVKDKQQQFKKVQCDSEPRRLFIVRIALNSDSEEIMLTNNMQLLKDNLIGGNIRGDNICTGGGRMNGVGSKCGMNNVNDNNENQQSQQLIGSYCQLVLRQVQEMRSKLQKQREGNKQQLIKLKQQNNILNNIITNMQQQIMQLKSSHNDQLILRQNQLKQKLNKQYQTVIQTIDEKNKTTIDQLAQQLRLKMLDIENSNTQLYQQRKKYNQQNQNYIKVIEGLQQKVKSLQINKQQELQQKCKQISQLKTELDNLQIITQNQKHLLQQQQQLQLLQQQQKLKLKQKSHSIILQSQKQLSSSNQQQSQSTQTDPQLVLDIDFLRRMKSQITKRRTQMMQMKLSPQNIKQNSSQPVIQQTHQDQQGVQYRICVPPSLDVIAFDFDHSVSSEANISPQKLERRKLSGKSSQSFYSNEKVIQEMYTIHKERHHNNNINNNGDNNTNNKQIRHNNNNISYVQSQRKQYLSQPMIPHECILSNNNSSNKHEQSQSSQQQDRIRVTPDDSGSVQLQRGEKKTGVRVGCELQSKKQYHHQHHPQQQHNQQLQVLKQLQMKPKVASYSQRNIIMQQLNEDEDHHYYEQQKKKNKFTSFIHNISNSNNHVNQQNTTNQQHKINYVNVTHHHYNLGQQQHQQHTPKIHHTNTLNDLEMMKTAQHHHNHHYYQKSAQSQQSDQLIPSRSALSSSSSSASTIKGNNNKHQQQQQLQKLQQQMDKHFLQDKFIQQAGHNYNDDDQIIDDNLGDSDHPSQTYKNSLRFPNGYCSGSMDKIQRHNKHYQYNQSYHQLSKSIGYNFHHDNKHPFFTQAKNAKQLLQYKSPQILMKSLIDKSFPIQKNPFKLSNQFINVAELMKQEKRGQEKDNEGNVNNYKNSLNINNKVDYLTVNKLNIKSSNQGSDSLVNIMIQSNQQHDHVQVSSSNPGTTKQRQSQQKITIQKHNKLKNQSSKLSGFKTPVKHKTIQLTESMDLELLKRIQESENVNQQEKKVNVNNANIVNNSKSKKKQKIIYLRR